ncbi:LamG domain-containing protein [Candidatus Poribacteria bacterium]|nr:LamG domain-containing protein [Candidatus Poribacteria bacterium]
MKFVSVFGLCLLIFALATGICAAQKLVLHLSFDELKGKVSSDLSEFGNDVTFKGSPKLQEGVFGKALKLDGKTYGEIADHDSLDIVDGITIEFWAIVEGGESTQSGVEKGRSWGPGLYNLAANYHGSSTLFQFFDLPDQCDDENTGQGIQDGKWHFLAGTWDGKTIRLYIDGKLDAEMKCAGELTPNADPLFIGARGGQKRFLTGALDEIKMYNYALTAEELLQDMTDPVQAVDAKDKLATLWGRLKTRQLVQ